MTNMSFSIIYNPSLIIHFTIVIFMSYANVKLKLNRFNIRRIFITFFNDESIIVLLLGILVMPQP